MDNFQKILCSVCVNKLPIELGSEYNLYNTGAQNVKGESLIENTK